MTPADTRSHNGNVFITGPASGIGAATTTQLVQAGYRVFAGVHRATGRLADLPGVQAVPLDVTDPDSVIAAARTVEHTVGTQGLQAVINNAGVIVQGPLELVPADQLRHQFDVNTLGPAYVTQAFLPLLREGHGRIINISAPTARVPIPFMAPISASKAALSSLSAALRLELAAWNIPVIIIEPGGTDTAIFDKAHTATQGALATTDPAKVALYGDQLAAVAKAAAKQKLGPADPVATAVVSAVEARKPKRRYTAGTGTAVFGLLAHAPTGLRERLIKSVFGLG